MEINLETDEKVKLVVDRTCEFRVWGERNDEGTMIIKYDTNRIKEEKPATVMPVKIKFVPKEEVE